jgi:Glycosyl hydrolases family 2, TIM barrel domain
MKRVMAVGMGLAMVLASAAGAVVFESRCVSVDGWDALGLGEKGDSAVDVVTDLSVPPGYGPEVLRVSGDVVLLMAQGVELTDGTLVALFRELDPRRRDADGVVLFWADYGADLTEARANKERRTHLWLEQDNDSGFQFRHAPAVGEELSIAQRAGYGIVTDPWNETRWIWQKVRVEGNRVQAKYWPAEQPEPEAWALETTYDGEKGKRCGIKINSSDIHLAYAAIDTDDIAVAAPSAYLFFPHPVATQTARVPLTLFTNAAEAVTETFDLTVTSGGKTLGQAAMIVEIPAGHGRTELTLTSLKAAAGPATLVLDKAPGEGPCTIALASGSGTYDTGRTLAIKPDPGLQKRLDVVAGAAEWLDSALARADSRTPQALALDVIRDAALGHLERARSAFGQGDAEQADLSLRFAENALAELRGYKGDWLKALVPRVKVPKNIPSEMDMRGIGKPKDAIADLYSSDYLISFDEPRSEAQSLAMGHSYEVVIPWRVEGGSPDRDFTFEVRLVSPLGNRTVARSTAGPDVPTSMWKAGERYEQRVKLDVLPENAPNPPAVLDEWHRLLVTVFDPESGARLILGNVPGPQSQRVGHSFLLADAYVSSTPLDICGFQPGDAQAMGTRTDFATIRNVGGATQACMAVLTATTETGRVVFQDAAEISVEPGGTSPVEFDWLAGVAGDVTLRLRLMRDGAMLTEAVQTVSMTAPGDVQVGVAETDTVVWRGDAFKTPVTVRASAVPRGITVHAAGRLVGQWQAGEGAEGTGEWVVEAEPWFGYYDVQVDFGDFVCDRRIIATVVETNGPDLLVNGEPFIVKGVNVHGMDAGSPARTRAMMQIMRDLGFNMWRGDYPPKWQIDLAYEMNTAYTVLAPFSCAHTTEIFGRQVGPPMATARELSRLTAQRYRDSAGVLLWNSCNEVNSETPDFLISQYPVYKAFDPKRRPVHYANLYGQDFPQGQDVMGVNYYFARDQRATDRQPMIARSLEVAGKAGLPLIYCEFNSDHGAIHSTGVEAMRDLFAWGVDKGMAGGFQYMKGNHTERHPGVFDGGFNTHKIYDEAIVAALADATVELVGTSPEALQLRIVNKRRCTLRQMVLKLSVHGAALEPPALEDLRPRDTVEVTVPVPRGLPGPALELEGDLRFVTHYGFQCRVPVTTIAK